MDITRTPPKRRNRVYIAAGALAAVVGTTVGLSRLRPAAPRVERATVIVDSVRRGQLVIEVRGPGSLVPEQIRWISAVTGGRVEQRLVEQGQMVKPETVLLELSNPDVQLEALDADRQLTAAQAERMNLQTTLETQRLNQRGVVATVRAQYEEVQRQAAVAESLVSRNLISPLEASRIRGQVTELATRYDVEQRRLTLMGEAVDSQVTLQRAQVERLRAVQEFQRYRVGSMKVRAGATGVVQELPLEVGQYAQPGAVLAKVVEPGRLKAQLRIPETQTRDLAIGQRATVDTRNGIIEGRVSRMDPAPQNGTLTVDIRLEGALPRGARPDLTVDGTIEVERLNSVLYTGRPAYGQANSTVGLFKLTGDGHAERISVKLGRASVNTVEVQAGLAVGDSLIVSDMSRWDGVDRVRID